MLLHPLNHLLYSLRIAVIIVVLVDADPLIRAQVARSDRAYDAFETCNHLFGFFLGIVNLMISLQYYVWFRDTEKTCGKLWRCAAWIVNLSVVLPVAICYIATPFFGGFALTVPATKVSPACSIIEQYG